MPRCDIDSKFVPYILWIKSSCWGRLEKYGDGKYNTLDTINGK
jgi:hypothetical protein